MLFVHPKSAKLITAGVPIGIDYSHIRILNPHLWRFRLHEIWNIDLSDECRRLYGTDLTSANAFPTAQMAGTPEHLQKDFSVGGFLRVLVWIGTALRILQRQARQRGRATRLRCQTMKEHGGRAEARDRWTAELHWCLKCAMLETCHVVCLLAGTVGGFADGGRCLLLCTDGCFILGIFMFKYVQTCTILGAFVKTYHSRDHKAHDDSWNSIHKPLLITIFPINVGY